MFKRVVIVEIYGLIREGLKLLCEQHADCEVVGQSAGIEETQALLDRSPTDIVLIDQGVVDNEGLEQIERLRESHPTVQIILFVARHDAQRMRAYLEAGVQGVLACQGSPGDLRFAIDSISRGEQFISPYAAKYLVNGFVRREADKKGENNGRRVTFTPRQRDVLRGLAQGKANKEIADELSISVKTVETHRARLMKTLRLNNANQLLQYAIRRRFDVAH
ncbi:MAG: hypothetical protein CMN28_16705 [Salinisphaeraceae bacterium]|jgi:two-component system response regulator NreC|nr:hypothetical protein [Salinisphaeraceae bacterium]